MANITLANARQALWKYASTVPFASATADDKAAVDGVINQAIERFLTAGKWRGTVTRAVFNVYDNQITLPNSLETILGAAPVTDEDENFGYALGVYNQWLEFSPAGPGKLVDAGLCGLIDIGDGYVGFRDPPTYPFYVKVISDLNETSKTILLRGLDENGRQIYSGGTTEGISVDLDNVGVTTTQQFTALSYWVKSASTNGITRLYSVDVTTSVQTLIAIIVPGKTVSGYRRYKVPSALERVEVIAKRAYVPAVSDNDEVIPGHIGALKLGMMALQYEDKNDLERAAKFWGPNNPEESPTPFWGAFDLLNAALAEFTGDNQIPTFQVAGDQGAGSVFNMM